MTSFLGVNRKLFSLILGTVIFSFMRGLKITNFVLDSFSEGLSALSQSVSNFSSFFMTQDISEGHLLPNNKLVSISNNPAQNMTEVTSRDYEASLISPTTEAEGAWRLTKKL